MDETIAWTVADHLAVGGNDSAGPALAHLEPLPQMDDSLALGGGLHHFLLEHRALN